MSALDHLNSIDETLNRVRQDHAHEVKTLQDQLLAAQIELQLCRGTTEREKNDRIAAERITMKLITQFGMVENIFSEAKRLALEITDLEHHTEIKTKESAS